MNFTELAREHGTPLFVYEGDALKRSAEEVLSLEAPFGFLGRYAVKANPHPQIIKLFDNAGLHFDASSVYEANELVSQGISGDKISLVTQSLKGPLDEALSSGVLPVASSIDQIKTLAKAGVKDIGLRVNPGVGSGHSNRTNVGGPASSFGVWHEHLGQAIDMAKSKNLTINRLHTHIGSGADPNVWKGVIEKSLATAEKLPDVASLDVGGGYKVARMADEEGTDLKAVIEVFAGELESFAARTGRELKLEIEPGTYLVANAGTLLATVEDIKDTGPEGYKFLVIDTGMNDILRPSLYGAQHPIDVLSSSDEKEDYVLVGHNCESGDILTPAPGDPESLAPRLLNRAAVGDVIAIGGAGAYCASMSAKGYNSFPSAKEIVI